ncbi:MAG: YMGG-like glycine zipper-containing protein [Pyrinomonadaceae bacterium]
MKKYFVTFLMMALFVIMLPFAAEAQTYVKRYRGRDGRIHYVRVKKPSFYRRHRNASNIALGTGGGAVLGALIGGRKGALIGAGVGAGSSAVYTYKIKKKKRRYYKVRRN